jgi:hypothetical protein
MADRRTWLRRYIVVCWVILGVSFVGWPIAAILLYEDIPIIVFILGWIANVLIAARIVADAYLRNGNGSASSSSTDRDS